VPPLRRIRLGVIRIGHAVHDLGHVRFSKDRRDDREAVTRPSQVELFDGVSPREEALL
jgi:hypothetical protein